LYFQGFPHSLVAKASADARRGPSRAQHWRSNGARGGKMPDVCGDAAGRRKRRRSVIHSPKSDFRRMLASRRKFRTVHCLWDCVAQPLPRFRLHQLRPLDRQKLPDVGKERRPVPRRFCNSGASTGRTAPTSVSSGCDSYGRGQIRWVVAEALGSQSLETIGPIRKSDGQFEIPSRQNAIRTPTISFVSGSLFVPGAQLDSFLFQHPQSSA
jgi:hypothetical protein